MSAIRGEGHGSSHDWICGETIQSPNRYSRATHYKCRQCDEIFYHNYHYIPDIFQAMQEAGVSKECRNKDLFKE